MHGHDHTQEKIKQTFSPYGRAADLIISQFANTSVGEISFSSCSSTFTNGTHKLSGIAAKVRHVRCLHA